LSSNPDAAETLSGLAPATPTTPAGGVNVCAVVEVGGGNEVAAGGTSLLVIGGGGPSLIVDADGGGSSAPVPVGDQLSPFCHVFRLSL